MSGLADSVPHILVVDDDRRIRELLSAFLIGSGLRVTAAASAREARETMRGLRFDLMVLDVMMPGETGIEFARSLRAGADDLPILILSAKAETEDRIEGLVAGVDDYLVKPFEPRELLLRIQAILKRRQSMAQRRDGIRFGPYEFNPARGELRMDGEPVHLTTRERDLLRLLAQRAGQTVPRNDLVQPGTDDGARSVDVQINRLRRKIEINPATPVYLQTVRGLGYILHAD